MDSAYIVGVVNTCAFNRCIQPCGEQNRIGKPGKHRAKLLDSGRTLLVINKELYPKLFDLVGKRVGGGRSDHFTVND